MPFQPSRTWVKVCPALLSCALFFFIWLQFAGRQMALLIIILFFNNWQNIWSLGMGSGASRNKAPATSLAVKESRAKAAQLEKELERLEAEKIELSKELSARLSDIEKLGELNRTLEKNNQKLKTEIDVTVSCQLEQGLRNDVWFKSDIFSLCRRTRLQVQIAASAQ